MKSKNLIIDRSKHAVKQEKELSINTGADSGYEGTFGPNSGPLYAIAVERGAITTPDAEWWIEAEAAR